MWGGGRGVEDKCRGREQASSCERKENVSNLKRKDISESWEENVKNEKMDGGVEKMDLHLRLIHDKT